MLCIGKTGEIRFHSVVVVNVLILNSECIEERTYWFNYDVCIIVQENWLPFTSVTFTTISDLVGTLVKSFTTFFLIPIS